MEVTKKPAKFGHGYGYGSKPGHDLKKLGIGCFQAVSKNLVKIIQLIAKHVF